MTSEQAHQLQSEGINCRRLATLGDRLTKMAAQYRGDEFWLALQFAEVLFEDHPRWPRLIS